MLVLLSRPSQARVGHRFHEAAHKRVWSSSDCGFDTADCRCRSSLHLIGRPVSDLGKRTVNVERFPNPALDTPTMPGPEVGMVTAPATVVAALLPTLSDLPLPSELLVPKDESELPEPGSIALMMLALIFIALMRPRSHRK